MTTDHTKTLIAEARDVIKRIEIDERRLDVLCEDLTKRLKGRRILTRGGSGPLSSREGIFQIVAIKRGYSWLRIHGLRIKSNGKPGSQCWECGPLDLNALVAEPVK